MALGELGAIELGPSRILKLWIGINTLIASAMLIAFPPWWIGLLASSVAALCARKAWLMHALRTHPQAVVALQLEEGALTRLRTAYGWVDCQLLSGTFFSPWLTILHLQTEGQERRVVLVPDCVLPEPFRRLRVVLAWGQTADRGIERNGSA